MNTLKPYICPHNTHVLSQSQVYLNSVSKSVFDDLQLGNSGVELYAIRHAKSSANATPDVIGGRSHRAVLVPQGIKQARLLGNRLLQEGVKFDGAFCSVSIRTAQTAEEVCNIIGFNFSDIEYSTQFMEISQGDWEGKDRNQLRTSEIKKQMDSETWNFRAPGGESPKDVEERMREGIHHYVSKIYKEGMIKKIALFTHGFSIKCSYRPLLNLNPLHTWKLNIENTSINKLFYDGSSWHILSINDDRHLNNI